MVCVKLNTKKYRSRNYDSFPYAVGDKYVYLLNEKKYAPIGEFDINEIFSIQERVF